MIYELKIVYKDERLDSDILYFSNKEVAEYYQKHYFDYNCVAYVIINEKEDDCH